MIENFSCLNLRCFDKKELNFEGEFTLIEGENGAGKTTVLEGIYLCIRGKSFLTGRLANLIKQGEGFFKVRAGIDGNIVDVYYSKIEGKKVFLLNGKRERHIKASLLFPLFVFNGRLLNFIRSDVITLYKFFNIIMSLYDKNFLKALSDYSKALKEKRSLLTSGGKNDSIEAWNAILSERGSIIREKRREFVKKINNILKGDAFILYKENPYSEKEKPVLERELREGRVFSGCHRDRFIILRDNKDLRLFYSSGQQKNTFFLILTAIGKIFSEKSGKKPVLLLDDFDSEFDSKNLRECLNNVLKSFQIILTTTDRNRYSGFDYNLITLKR